MLHVMVEAVDAWDSTDLGVRESSRLSSIGRGGGGATWMRGRTGVRDPFEHIQIHFLTRKTGARSLFRNRPEHTP